MNKAVFAIFVLLAAVAAAVVHWTPVQKYTVECARAPGLICTLERIKAAETKSWHFEPGSDAAAFVRVRSASGKVSERVYLYIRSGGGEIFAAEFEGGDAKFDAEVAAVKLNHVFISAEGRTRIEVEPPAYYRWLSWAGVGFMAMLGAVVWADSRRAALSVDRKVADASASTARCEEGCIA